MDDALFNVIVDCLFRFLIECQYKLFDLTKLLLLSFHEIKLIHDITLEIFLLSPESHPLSPIIRHTHSLPIIEIVINFIPDLLLPLFGLRADDGNLLLRRRTAIAVLALKLLDLFWLQVEFYQGRLACLCADGLFVCFYDGLS